MRYLWSLISKLFSKNLVAVMVLHVTMNKLKKIPTGFMSLKNSDPRARSANGSSEYPNMLIVLYNSTYTPFFVNRLINR